MSGHEDGARKLAEAGQGRNECRSRRFASGRLVRHEASRCSVAGGPVRFGHLSRRPWSAAQVRPRITRNRVGIPERESEYSEAALVGSSRAFGFAPPLTCDDQTTFTSTSPPTPPGEDSCVPSRLSSRRQAEGLHHDVPMDPHRAWRAVRTRSAPDEPETGVVV